MLQQHFNAIHECAKQISQTTEHSLMSSPPISNTSTTCFEQALDNGLHTSLNQLSRNAIGFCYRSIPVTIYDLNNSRTIHISSKCQSTDDTHAWGWVTSNPKPLLESGYKWCEECLSDLDLPLTSSLSDAPINFMQVVHLHKHIYFNVEQTKLWRPGQSISHLERSAMSNEVAEQALIACDNCTWTQRVDSPYILLNDQALAYVNSGNYCIFCAQDRLRDVLLLPTKLRWQGLQERFQYFNGVCENWAQLRFHMDESWHPLINLLQNRQIAPPSPYYKISQSRFTSIVAPLAWPDQKKAVFQDAPKNDNLPSDWSAISYSNLIASL